MKKIILGLTIILFSAVSAQAAPAFLGNLSLTAGLANNEGVFGASATETNLSETGTAGHIKKEHGVFTDSFGSQFIELGIGSWFSVGYEHTPDSVSTPQNTTRQNSANESTVSVDFNDVNTSYVKLNLPFGGLYVKAGTVETDLDIKETMGSGSTYANVSTSGNVTAIGHSSFIKDTGFGLRVEAAYMELDNVSTNNGATPASVANGGLNTIDATDMQGLTGKIAITYTFGRD